MSHSRVVKLSGSLLCSLEIGRLKTARTPRRISSVRTSRLSVSVHKYGAWVGGGQAVEAGMLPDSMPVDPSAICQAIQEAGFQASVLELPSAAQVVKYITPQNNGTATVV
jgi:hypothetical protein